MSAIVPRLHHPDSPLPITHGSIRDFAQRTLHWLRLLHAQHGHLAALQDGENRLYFSFGPDFNHQVLTDSNSFHSRFFAVRGPRHSAQRRLSSGLLSMNGEQHRQHRRIVMSAFQKKTIVGYHDTIAHITRSLLDRWQLGSVVDVNEEMTRHMLYVMGSILFGLEFPELAFKVGLLTERWVALNHKIGPSAFDSLLAEDDDYQNLLDTAEELEAGVREMLHQRRSSTLGDDVLSLLIRAHDAEGLSDDHLIGHVALLFGAAHLTSAHTLTWTLYLLAQHPHIMSQLSDELSSHLGNQPIQPQQLDQLPLLDRVIKESMRILPASAYSQRIAAQPVQLGPFQLDIGAPVIFSQFITHRLPELYPQPDQFLPDRWLSINPSAYAYLPFGAGPRMCIGAALGTMSLKITLPSILQRFTPQLVSGSLVTGQVVSTMLHPMTPLPMQLLPAGSRPVAAHVTGNIHDLVRLPADLASIRHAA